MAKKKVSCVSLNVVEGSTRVWIHRSPPYCRLYGDPTETSLCRLSNLLQSIQRGFVRGKPRGFVRLRPNGWSWFNYNVEE